VSGAVHPVPDTYQARYGPADVEAMRQKAETDPDGFWLDLAKRLDWYRPPTKAGDWSYNADDFHISWYADGQLNLSVNCLDRQLDARGDKVALIFEAD
jgi:acetyl-CoA synthetase